MAQGTTPRPAQRVTRRRRSAEDARREILDAAQRRLMEAGAEGVRLHDIAADVGISHAAILHHFASREGLLQALAARVLRDVTGELLRAAADPSPETQKPGAVLDRMFATLRDGGSARLLGWRCLTRRDRIPDGQHQLRQLVEMVHQRASDTARRVQVDPPSIQEAAFCMRLAIVSMVGDALIGEDVNASVGDSADAQREFRRWLGQLIADRLTISTPATEG
jgi:AcrR family transcriptional regulator